MHEAPSTLSLGPSRPAALSLRGLHDGETTLDGYLDASEHERRALYATLGAFRAAVAHCEHAGRTLGTTANALLHQQCYAELRTTSGLPANLVIRAIAAAARRLKAPTAVLPALEYDSRVARLHGDGLIDLSTITGRVQGIAFIPSSDPLPIGAGLLRLSLSPDADGTFHAALTVRRAVNLNVERPVKVADDQANCGGSGHA